MVDVSRVLATLQCIVLLIVVILSILYTLLSILIPHLRHRLHAFHINVCMSILCCCIYWLVQYCMSETSPRQFYSARTCSVVFYFQTMCTLQVPLSMIVVSIHRLCCVVYHNKLFFKSIQWISTCIISQWLIGMIISLPMFVRNQTTCSLASWMTYYILVITIIIPVLLCAILNLTIFNYVTSSTKRIHPQSQASTGHTNESQGKFNQRDIHLLRHMIIMFLVFVIGWSPIFITSVVMSTNAVSSLILRIFSLLAELSLLCDIIDLFLYSHNLKVVLKRIIPCYGQ